MDRKQSMYVFKEGEFTELELDPFNVSPLGLMEQAG
jgi:hypothetical protein